MAGDPTASSSQVRSNLPSVSQAITSKVTIENMSAVPVVAPSTPATTASTSSMPALSPVTSNISTSLFVSTSVSPVVSSSIPASIAERTTSAPSTASRNKPSYPVVTSSVSVFPVAAIKIPTSTVVTSSMATPANVTCSMSEVQVVESSVSVSPLVSSSMPVSTVVTRTISAVPNVSCSMSASPAATSSMPVSQIPSTKMPGSTVVGSCLTTSTNVTSSKSASPTVTSSMPVSQIASTKMPASKVVGSSMTTSTNVSSSMSTSPTVTSSISDSPLVSKSMQECPLVTSSMSVSPIASAKIGASTVVASTITSSTNASSSISSFSVVTNTMTPSPLVSSSFPAYTAVTSTISVAPTVLCSMSASTAGTSSMQSPPNVPSSMAAFSLGTIIGSVSQVVTSSPQLGSNLRAAPQAVVQQACLTTLTQVVNQCSLVTTHQATTVHVQGGIAVPPHVATTGSLVVASGSGTGVTVVPQTTTQGGDILITEEDTNFLRFTTLILKVAPRALRKLFDMNIHPNNLLQKLSEKTNKEKLKDLQAKRVITKDQWKNLYPAHGNVSSQKFDLTLMILLLRDVCGVSAPQSGWNKLPPANDHSEGADLARFKFYRNETAHSTTCSINNHDFSNMWTDLSQAVIRVGGQAFTTEVSSLLTSALDQSYKEIYQELNNLKDADMIPPSKQYYQHVKIGVWTDEENTFVSTKASKTVEKCVGQNDVVMVTGPPGSGKSAIIHHIALQLNKEGYKVYPVMSTKEVVDYWKPEAKQVFVLDDIFGVNIVDEAELNQWEKNQDTLKICFQYSSMKILSTVRSLVIQDERVSSISSVLNENVVCIVDGEISLSSSERLNIFQKHASFQKRDDLLKMTTEIENFSIYCFPLLCKIYTADKKSKHSVEAFFKQPLSVIDGEISDLQKRDPLKYFCLLFCMIYDSNLDTSVINLGDESKETKIIRKAFLELCGLPTSSSRVQIKSEMDTLLNTFLLIEGNKYHFIHDVIYDAVVRYVGRLPSGVHRIILRHCSSNTMKERVRLMSLDCKDAESSIVLRKDMELTWGYRLLKDIKEGHWPDVFNNTCLATEKGDQILTKALHNMDKNDIENFMCLVLYALDEFHNKINIVDDLGLSDTLRMKINHTPCSPFHLALLVGLRNVVNEIFMSITRSTKDKLNCTISLFLLACVAGNEDIIKTSINEGVDLNQFEHDDSTPLHVSSQNGRDRVVTTLIDHGADVNQCDNYSRSPLHYASDNGHEKVAKLLINNGADVNKCDNDGRSPLFASSGFGRYKVAEVLIDHGADIDKCDNDGRSPLYASSYNGHDTVVKLLIDNGADVNKYDNYGWSNLHSSSYYRHNKVVKLLIDNGADINALNKDGESPLYVSSQNGYDDVVKFLTDKGADMNKCNNDGESPLYVSVQSGHDKVAKLLIENGADVKKRNNDGWSPLYVSSYNGHDKAVKLLIKNGADVNECYNDGETCLHVSSYNGHDKVVKILIENGADVNKCDNYGESSLHVSSCNGQDKIVKLLIDNGCDVNKCYKNGWSPLYLSSSNGHDKIVKLLIDKGADVNQCDNNGWSPLYVSSFKGYDKVVKLLIDNGADVNKCDNNGWSPLYVSSFKGNAKVEKLLKDNGASVN